MRQTRVRILFEEYLSFYFTFLFHLGFRLIQLKVTKNYEIAGRGSPESRLGLVVNLRHSIFRVTAT